MRQIIVNLANKYILGNNFRKTILRELFIIIFLTTYAIKLLDYPKINKLMQGVSSVFFWELIFVHENLIFL